MPTDSEKDDAIAHIMHRLYGLCSTPTWLAKDAREIKGRGLMYIEKFDLADVWNFTAKGRAFLTDRI